MLTRGSASSPCNSSSDSTKWTWIIEGPTCLSKR
jgi:hypothetical protein